MLQRTDKLSLIKKINLCIVRNKNNFTALKEKLETIGFTKEDVNRLINTNDLINLSDFQLMIVAHKCDELFNATLFKSYDEQHRTWSEVPDYGSDYVPMSKTLTFYHCKEFYKEFYLGYTSINELFSALSTNAIIKSTIPFNAITEMSSYTQVRDKEISPLILYSDDIQINPDGTINITSGTIPLQALYFLIVLKNSFDNNVDIPVYIMLSEQKNRNTLSYSNFYSNVTDIIKNDIIQVLKYDVFDKFEHNILKCVTDIIISNRNLEYDIKIQRVAACLMSIDTKGTQQGTTIKNAILGSLNNE